MFLTSLQRGWLITRNKISEHKIFPYLHYFIMENVDKIDSKFGDGFVSVTNQSYCQTKNKIFMNIFTILGVGFCPPVI